MTGHGISTLFGSLIAVVFDINLIATLGKRHRNDIQTGEFEKCFHVHNLSGGLGSDLLCLMYFCIEPLYRIISH